MNNKKILTWIVILSIVGLLTSLYLTAGHFKGAEQGSFCDFSETISCSIVNTSVFSQIANVPVALFGAIWFVILLAMSIRAKKDKKLTTPLFLWNIAGLLSIGYFIFAEFMLKALCPLCTIVHIIILITFILSSLMFKKEKKHNVKAALPWILAAIVLCAIPLIAFNVAKGPVIDYTEDAKCITEKGVNMYGSFRCGVCAKTRSMFGDAFEHINEIECHPQGQNAQTELCFEKEIERTPTWILEPEGVETNRAVGFMSVQELKEFAGCTT